MQPSDLALLANELAKFIQTTSEDITAILLIGSLAVGRASADSDIDLAILTNETNVPEPVCEFVDGVMVGYEYFSNEQLRSLPASPLFDQNELRNAARLATGRVLIGDAEDLSELLAKLARARLHPAEAIQLFVNCENNLATLANPPDPFIRTWSIQGLASGLAVLALNLTPPRFQKPKWVLQDLAANGEHELLDVISRVFPPDNNSLRLAAPVVHQARRLVETVFSMHGFGTPHYTGSDHDLDYIFRTQSDAESLVSDQQWKPAGFTATTAVRLAGKLLFGRFPNDARAIEISSMSTLVTEIVSETHQKSISDDEKLPDVLRGQFERLGELYARQYVGAQDDADI